MQKLSYTLILIYQLLKTVWQHTSKCTSWASTLIFMYKLLKTAWQHTKTNAGVELHVDSDLPTLPGSTPKQVQELSYTLILIYQHFKQPGSTPKRSSAVELHVDSHLPTLETAWQHTKTSAEVELHVGSHYKKLETAWQQKLSYTLILIYQHLKQPGSTPNKCRSWATRWFSFTKN